jgi:hypothetical protein
MARYRLNWTGYDILPVSMMPHVSLDEEMVSVAACPNCSSEMGVSLLRMKVHAVEKPSRRGLKGSIRWVPSLLSNHINKSEWFTGLSSVPRIYLRAISVLSAFHLSNIVEHEPAVVMS